MEIKTEIISFKEWEQDITDFISSFDDDASGANGKDYLVDEAKEQGYDNNIDYWIDEAKKKFDEFDTYAMVDFVLNELLDTYWSYKASGYDINDIQDFLIVTFVYC